MTDWIERVLEAVRGGEDRETRQLVDWPAMTAGGGGRPGGAAPREDERPPAWDAGPYGGEATAPEDWPQMTGAGDEADWGGPFRLLWGTPHPSSIGEAGGRRPVGDAGLYGDKTAGAPENWHARTDAAKGGGPGSGFYEQARQTRRAAAGTGPRRAAAVSAPGESGGAAGTDAAELDRIFQRDARRYDGGFSLY